MTSHLTLDREEASSYQAVPCTPYLKREPVLCASPAPTVPDVDTNIHSMQQSSGRQAQLFVVLNSSPHSNSSIGQVPSVSPRTPVTRYGNHYSATSREQLVPSQSPFLRTTTVSPGNKNTTRIASSVETLQLFSDDDSIFL